MLTFINFAACSQFSCAHSFTATPVTDEAFSDHRSHHIDYIIKTKVMKKSYSIHSYTATPVTDEAFSDHRSRHIDYIIKTKVMKKSYSIVALIIKVQPIVMNPSQSLLECTALIRIRASHTSSGTHRNSLYSV